MDPEGDGIHPLRHTLTDDDWDRLDRIVVEDSDEDCTAEELEAYSDWLYDQLAGTLQTVYGVTTIQ